MVSAEQPQMSLMTSGIPCVFLRQGSWFTLAFLPEENTVVAMNMVYSTRAAAGLLFVLIKSQKSP